jgi:acid phosphatase type 7
MSTQFLTAEEVADLGMRLRAAGYGVGPDQCIAAQRLMLMLAAQGVEFADRRALKSWLSPVFCSNPTEQADFAAHYEEWLSGKDGALPLRAFALAVKTLQPSASAPARVSHLRQAMVLAVVLLVLAGALFRGKQIRSELIYRTVRVRVVDQENILLRDAVLNFRGARIRPQADGLFTIGFRLIDLPAKIVATRNNFEDSIDLDPRDYEQTQTLRLGPVAVAQTTRVEPQENDRLLLTATESDYLSKTLSFAGPKPGTEQPSTPQRFYETHYRELLVVSASLPLFLAGLWLLWVHLPRLQLIRWKSQKDIRLESLRVKGSEADFFNRPAFRRIAQQLRRHRLAESTDLDPERTVFESANRAGWFTPVYLWRQRLPDYLILIDRAGFRDFQGRLIDDFVKSLRLGRVEIDCYDFYSDPRACYLRTDAEITGAVRKKKSRAFSQVGSTLVAVEDAPEAGNSGQGSRRVTLDDLLAKHPNHNLLIFTEATGFFSSMTGQVQPWVERFSQWAFRVVFVPEEMVQSRSNRRVAMLRDRGFLVLPASEKGWSRAVDILDSGTRVYVPGGGKSGSSSPYPSLLQSDALRWMSDIAPSPALVSLLMGQLRAYLGEEMFPWLCACAVYPELSWDLTLYLGSALKILGTDERRLATILRLPWFRKGSMPEWLRQSLTQAMQPEELERVRHALWGLLETALDHPLHSFDLRYATEKVPDRQQKGWRTRLRRMLLRNYLRTEADHGGLQDYVFVSVLEGRKPALGLSVPEKLRRLFGRIGKPTRPIAQLVIALLASGAITGYLYLHRPILTSETDAPTIPEKLPSPTGTAPYHLNLSSVVGSPAEKAIEASGSMVLQVTGDTGGANNPASQQLVADTMAAQFASAKALDLQGARLTPASLSSSRPSSSSQAGSPSFLYLLGNVAYSDGETHNYSSQFYQPYRNYPAEIFAIPGNHDGIHDSDGTSLTGFLRNFCAKSPVHTPDAGGTSRTAVMEPNPYWTLETPFATIIGMYTNVTNEGYVDKNQESWLATELHNAPSNKAVIIAMNHSIYSMSSGASGSAYLSRVLDRAMIAAGRAPDLVLSARENNYQRFSRTFAGSGRVIPYVVVGTGGYPNLKRMPAGLKPPVAKGTDLVLEAFNDTQHGFLELIASSSALTARYNTAVSTRVGPGSQVVDSFTIDLKPATAPAPRTEIVTRLTGKVSPAPPDPRGWLVSVVGQSSGAVNKSGGFDVPVKGVAGQSVTLQLFLGKELISKSAQTLPGPVTIQLPEGFVPPSGRTASANTGSVSGTTSVVPTTTASPPPQSQSTQNQQVQTTPTQNQQSPPQQTQNAPPQTLGGQNLQTQAPPPGADSGVLSAGRDFESPDKTMVARIDQEKNLWVLSGSGNVLVNLAQVSSSTAVAWSADSKFLAWSYGAKITISEVQTKNAPIQLDGGSGQILVLAWSPDGRWIASGADDNVVRIWEPASGRSAVGATGPSPARNLQWSDDARQLVATWQDGTTKEIKVPSRGPAPPTGLKAIVK